MFLTHPQMNMCLNMRVCARGLRSSLPHEIGQRKQLIDGLGLVRWHYICYPSMSNMYVMLYLFM